MRLHQAKSACPDIFSSEPTRPLLILLHTPLALDVETLIAGVREDVRIVYAYAWGVGARG